MIGNTDLPSGTGGLGQPPFLGCTYIQGPRGEQCLTCQAVSISVAYRGGLGALFLFSFACFGVVVYCGCSAPCLNLSVNAQRAHDKGVPQQTNG